MKRSYTIRGSWERKQVWLSLFLSVGLLAVPAWGGVDFPLPPRGSLVAQYQEDLAPDNPGQTMVIRLYEDAAEDRIREFEINGAVFQIHVAPRSGPGYYLVDTTGKGRFDMRVEEDEAHLLLPPWVLFRK
ncbi:MAG: DUF2782 domain-containing protein [Magnetococcales bacterium]|nr:DUF2782 domain-containing protein [Magnetococcales bacterium]